MSQLNLLREQLSTEMSARIEADNRNKQLLHHNKELLNHLHVLVQHIQELEGRPRDYAHISSTKGSSTASPQVRPLSSVTNFFLFTLQFARFQSPCFFVFFSSIIGFEWGACRRFSGRRPTYTHWLVASLNLLRKLKLRKRSSLSQFRKETLWNLQSSIDFVWTWLRCACWWGLGLTNPLHI